MLVGHKTNKGLKLTVLEFTLHQFFLEIERHQL
jgi:hypothetical protein